MWEAGEAAGAILRPPHITSGTVALFPGTLLPSLGGASFGEGISKAGPPIQSLARTAPNLGTLVSSHGNRAWECFEGPSCSFWGEGLGPIAS